MNHIPRQKTKLTTHVAHPSAGFPVLVRGAPTQIFAPAEGETNNASSGGKTTSSERQLHPRVRFEASAFAGGMTWSLGLLPCGLLQR